MKLDYQSVLEFVRKSEIESLREDVEKARDNLLNKTGAGNDFLGWVNYPREISVEEIKRIKEAAEGIRKSSDLLLVIGIGGSYLGAKAGLEMLKGYFPKEDDFPILFIGHTLSSSYTKELLDYLHDKDFSINVISKSGTTTEPALAFRFFRQLLEEKYGEEHHKHIFVTTTLNKGALYHLAISKNYQVFSIPEDIGGRYSVLTPVGLLPLASSGIDIEAIIEGANQALEKYQKQDFLENDALLYAAIRNLLYQKGKKIEILVTYEPKLTFFSEWYKQLFGESEGKDHKGIYPSSLVNTTDLHSLGQYVQDGERIIFETVLNILETESDLIVHKEADDFDGLNYLAGKSLDEVNKQALKATAIAHVEGGVPNLRLDVLKINPHYFGQLVYFFMFACGISGYLLKVNPFNQEGVEAYKRNMFALLGKPGYQKLREELEKK